MQDDAERYELRASKLSVDDFKLAVGAWFLGGMKMVNGERRVFETSRNGISDLWFMLDPEGPDHWDRLCPKT